MTKKKSKAKKRKSRSSSNPFEAEGNRILKARNRLSDYIAREVGFG